MLAAARRIVLLAAAAIGITAVVSGAIGAALGDGLVSSAVVGLYLVGCFLLVLGIFAGVRGPLRAKGTDEGREAIGSLFGYGLSASGIRSATADEQADTRSTTWLFLWLGAVLIVAGALLDPRTSVY